jgi:hypothetical protein
MKARLIVLALAAVVTAATPQSSEARGYRHCTYFLHYDYAHSNALSPMSTIYPAANWGPFFQCHMYVGPVLVLLRTPAPY